MSRNTGKDERLALKTDTYRTCISIPMKERIAPCPVSSRHSFVFIQHPWAVTGRYFGTELATVLGES